MSHFQDRKEGIAVHPNPFVRETLQLCPFLRNRWRTGVETVERTISKGKLQVYHGNWQKALTWTEVGAQARAAVRRHCRRAGAKERTANILDSSVAGMTLQIICKIVIGGGGGLGIEEVLLR